MMLKVATLLVILLVTLHEASGESFPGPFSQKADDPEENLDFNININNNIFLDMTGTDHPGKLFQDIDETNQALVIFKLQKQVKDLLNQVKDLAGQVKKFTLDLCRTKRDCCNKTQACPCGTEWFNERPDMCYKFSEPTNKKSYADARSDCQAAGGHLAIPKDQATNDFLVKQIKTRYLNQHIWIGLTDQMQEGTWVWDDGTKLGTGWNDWYPGHPVGDFAANCAVWHVYVSPYKWHDYVCISTNNYICEMKATTAP